MSRRAKPPEPPSAVPPRRRSWIRRFAWATLTLLILLLVTSIGAVLVVRSAWFSNKVRERIASEVEKASGGRAELASFRFDWKTLDATVVDFVLHGTEGPKEAPLLQAKRIDVGLGITSFVHLNGVHVRSIQVDQPALHVIATEDGKTNLPAPKIKHTDKDFLDTLLELAAAQITIRNGTFDLNDHRIPLDLSARDVGLRLLYNTNRLKPAYSGNVSSKQVKVDALNLGSMAFGYESNFMIEHGTLSVSKATFSTRESKIEVSGFAYHLLNPSTDFGVNASITLNEFAEPLHIPVEHTGVAQFAGKVSLQLKDHFSYLIEGKVKGKGLAIRQGQIAIDNAAVSSQVVLSPAGLKMSHLELSALGGEFAGSAELAAFKTLTVDGTIKNFAVHQLLTATGQRALPYAASVSGPVHLTTQLSPPGFIQSVVNTNATLTAAIPETSREIPIEGSLNVTWTQAAATIELQESHLETAASSIDFSGTLGQRLDVNARSMRLSDIQSLLDDPKLPIELDKGSVTFQGAVTGPLDNPRIEGHGTLTSFRYQQQAVDQVTADFAVTRDKFDARSFSVSQGALTIEGAGGIALRNWKADEHSTLTAKVNATGIRIEKALAQFKQTQWPVTGSATVTANLHGSAEALSGDAQITAEDLTAWDEQVDRLQASATLTPERVEVTSGMAVFHKSEIPFHGSYTHKPDDWQSGSVALTAKAPSLDLAQIQNFTKRVPQWKATVSGTASANGTIAGGVFHLTALTADASARGITYEDRQVGTAELKATTSGSNLDIAATGAVHGSRLRLNGQWKLGDGYPGGGEISATSMTIQALHDLGLTGDRPPLPFQSAVEAGATFRAPLTNLNQYTADVKIQRLFIAPGATQKLGAGAREQDLILENAHPIVLHVTPSGATLETALFRATNTNIEVSGKIGFEPKVALDLAVKGGLNLGQLQMFRQDLLASGTAAIDATVHGSFTDPQVNGSLTLSKASLYFGDLPVGLDNVNGSVTFDRNRATIQSLAAESGGGKMGLTGFVGFGGPALVYRLQGNAIGVRVRYPEGASTTVNASLTLNGTSQDSLLNGSVTIVRAAFTPRSDLGALMVSLTRPNAAPVPQDNDYIRGMQLDVRLESQPNLEFQTSLTRGLQAEVDLKLRGTAARPTLLGSVSFSEGEMSLFGNQYTLTRGDIRFYNPTRIDPIFDIEAQTRARGIDVNVSFSGTASKLNVSYTSDPPLQPSDIIALLAIGRDPNVAAGLAASQMTQQSPGGGLGNVVGEAVASSLTNRLQKFFGVTKIKIDPQLTGLDNIPQARLTLEQQVSKDITMTFITNIARTSEQIVRIQWDFSRQWSGVAIRDENGLFGIDVQYKRRFK